MQSQPYGFHLLAKQYSHLIGDSEPHISEFDEFIQSAIRNSPSDARTRVVLPEIIQILHILLQEYMVLELHSQECYSLAQLLGTLTQAEGWASFNEYYISFFEFSPSEMARTYFAPLRIDRPLNEPFCIFRHLSSGAPLCFTALVKGLRSLCSDPAEEMVSSILPGLLTLSGKRIVSVDRFIPSLQIYLRDSYSEEELQGSVVYENFIREPSASPPLDISRLIDEKGFTTDRRNCYSEPLQEELFADHRLTEVRDLLSPSAPETFVFPDMNELSAKSKAEITSYRDRYLSSLVTARMVGISLLTFRTRANIVIKPASWTIFEGQFVLSGVNSEGLKYTVDKESPVWVLFQQGIITALQVSSDATSCILPNSSADLPQLGGYLFGLGLQGRLRGLANVDFYMSMSSNNPYSVSGVLLGLAASNFASHSPGISALIEVSLPADSPQIHDVKSMSALLSLALVNFCSNDSRLMHRALDHIDVPVISGGIKEQASLTSATILTAGMSLGFLGFGMGPAIEPYIVNRLREMFTTRSDYALQLGLAMLFFNTNSKESLQLLERTRVSLRDNPLAQMINHLCQCLVRWSHSPMLTQEPVSRTSSHFGAKSAAEVFALGLRYMGTCQADVLASIQGISDGFQKLACEAEDPFRCAVYNSFLVMTHVAMSLVMAGSGDLGVLQRLRGFQRRREASVDYGHLSANSLALGLLMVGEGRFCITKEKHGSVALMLLTVLPLFPQAPEDLDPFPQIFRSFWVLTLEPKSSLSTDTITSPNLDQTQSPASFVPRGLSDVLKKVPLSSVVDLPPLASSKRMPATCFSSKQLVPQYGDKSSIKMASFVMLYLYSSISKGMPLSLIAKIVEGYCKWEAHLGSTSSRGVATLKPGLKAFLAFQIVPSILRLRKTGTSLQ
ncbi:Anaphase-promoting complex subunit 1 [Entomophthora muscae]|uniref:Anaphase-promoting complex subunit 1 n=1 Tax=Entomophthora muscae TaxID=34485 RepID=A0ACC2SGB2_9FUNG|nr:Anaphase-promoting complex subunit 1 [Entomophthora muscae]